MEFNFSLDKNPWQIRPRIVLFPLNIIIRGIRKSLLKFPLTDDNDLGPPPSLEGLNGFNQNGSNRLIPDFSRQRSVPGPTSDYNTLPPPPVRSLSGMRNQRDDLDFDPCEFAIKGLKSLELEQQEQAAQHQHNNRSFNNLYLSHNIDRHEPRLVCDVILLQILVVRDLMIIQ